MITVDSQRNVLFHKTRDVSFTKASWLFTFVLDLKSHERWRQKLGQDIRSMDILNELTSIPVGNGNFRELPQVYRREVSSQNITHGVLVRRLKEILSIRYKHRAGKQPGVFPVHGEQLHWLLKTTNEKNVKNIKQNIMAFTKKHKELRYLTGSAPIVNLTHVEINQMQYMTQYFETNVVLLDTKLVNISDSIRIQLKLLNHAYQTYSQITLLILELNDALIKGTAYLDSIEVQLNQLALARLSPSVINPQKLYNILRWIQDQLPEDLAFSESPASIRYYYQSLETVTLFENDRFITVVSAPLIDTSRIYELFRVHNIPVPCIEATLSAEYELESQYPTVNKYQYMLLDLDQLSGCDPHTAVLDSKQVTECDLCGVAYCDIKLPSYPINTFNLCIIALYTGNKDAMENNCNVKVDQQRHLPYAYYVTDGLWAIITQTEILFIVLCVDGSSYVKVAKPPLTYIILTITCRASAPELSLPPYYHSECSNEKSYVRELLLQANQEQLSDIWSPIPDVMSSSEVVNSLFLGDISNITLSQLKNTTKNLEEKYALRSS